MRQNGTVCPARTAATEEIEPRISQRGKAATKTAPREILAQRRRGRRENSEIQSFFLAFLCALRDSARENLRGNDRLFHTVVRMARINNSCFPNFFFSFPSVSVPSVVKQTSRNGATLTNCNPARPAATELISLMARNQPEKRNFSESHCLTNRSLLSK